MPLKRHASFFADNVCTDLGIKPSMAMPIGDASGFGEFLEHFIRGWRYLFSRSYRIKKNQQWREDWLTAFFEIPFAVCVVIISAGLLGWAVCALWSLLRH
ncbi:MAG TPA: hypothetical protein PLB55_23610 [Prosthecobacter sp.]|nr:hypothetical protein [Prosthecobacter sp.]